jgi:hypothetical protein
MKDINDLHQELDELTYLNAKMRDEGFDYCFRHYSSFEEIKDEKFHELRLKYIQIAEELENYVETQYELKQDEIDNYEEKDEN